MAMQRKAIRSRIIRAWIPAALCAVALGALLTQCPANRDGAPGQLAKAMQESSAAARSGALALDLVQHGRSTTKLAAVQLADARDEAVKSYQGIAELRVQDPVDLRRQGNLTGAINGIITDLNAATGAVREVAGQNDMQNIRDRLLAAAAELENRYR